MHSIKILKRAELELFDASQWYEKKQKGLSLKFRAAIKSTLESIVLNPFIFSKRYNTELRFALVYKFPYVIVYWFDESLDIVFVTSIFHTKRDADKFKNE
ncbi:MAG: type II toxin-antitoxin system RelE/ParE family toxin [Sphingobacteriales bacterium]